ncbi:aminoglycoside phosphotransferase family protein [Acidaminobacter sp. JC074]|uniref:phosphotransferase family protein n=1 Tax=Acidaminobacter sp. JC074 TaxID=2530199 RepID=UPI001F0DDFC6|nr:aminoglycoside phosphotransferase family protein [Acidaminobacter sp. JC074]MCH4889919.1 aminoglycoside phosphotransferase family protein [Acidaminobacter sp. JC074]
MAVQRYSRNEMQAIVESILKKDVVLLPIGNHELRRHLVYKVKTEEGDFAFKYYYQDTYGGREISTLKLLDQSQIKHAKLVSSGTFGQEREWLLMEMLDGMPMDKIMKHIPEDELLDIYKSMGEELAKLHEYKKFDHYGSLDANLKFVKPYSDFKKAFLESNRYAFDKVKSCDHDIKDFLLHGLKMIENNLFLLDYITSPTLTHFDYSPRNIFISKENGQRKFKAILDFELCRPWDKNADFTHLMLRDFPENPKAELAFFEGYRTYSKLDKNMHKTMDLYMLTLCVNVCSWAKDIAPVYYDRAYNKLIQLLTQSRNLK